MQIPVFCQHCGAIFDSRAFRFVNATNVTLRGNRETCPNCGRMAEIPDGVFDFVGDTITVLSAPQRTQDQLRRLQDILRAARADRVSPADLADTIRRDAPDLEPIVSRLLVPKSPGELYALLTLVLTVISLILMRSEGSQLSPHEAEQLVQQAVTQAMADPPAPPNLPGGATVLPPTSASRALPLRDASARSKRSPKTFGKQKRRK